MNDVEDVAGPPPDIVVVTHFFPSHGGGIELVAARLVDEYLEAGLSVDWFASATDEPPPAKPGLQVHPIRATNVVERLTQLPYPLWMPSAIPALWRSIGRARAVHIHEHLYVGSLMALFIGRLRQKTVVLTQHMGALGLPTRWATLLYTVATKGTGVADHAACVPRRIRERERQGFFRDGRRIGRASRTRVQWPRQQHVCVFRRRAA